MIESGELSSYLHRIDRLTFSEEYVPVKEITKKHWQDKKTKKKCSLWSCRKSFSIVDWAYNCRRCGEVFCTNCLQYQRKLNKLARPDPNGQNYKVCKKCFEEGRETEGANRSWTNEFKIVRKMGQQNRQAILKGHEKSSRYARLHLESECQRLIEGFRNSFVTSEVKRTLQELRHVVTTPDWQKSSIWIQENISNRCSTCSSEFSILRTKYSCSVCGVAVCKKCSCKDLLVFIPDDEQTNQPELAIIKIVGCPKVEPDVSLYLRVCTKCRDLLEIRQLTNYHHQGSRPESLFLSSLTRLHDQFQSAEAKINSHLSEYKTIVTSLENNSKAGGSSQGRGTQTAERSNMKILAKAQEDVADYLTQHVTLTQQLKKLKPETHVQSDIFKVYIKSKCDYYMENMSTFRLLGKQFCETSPPEVLEFIQRTMNKDAIVSAHLYIRQLIYETLNISDKYKLGNTLPTLLMTVEEIVEEEVGICLQKEGEDINQHKLLLQEMIKEQLAEHKLIRPSRRLLQQHGSQHAQSIMWSRSVDVLKQMSLQLKLKTSDKSFSKTKTTITDSIQKVESKAKSL